MPSSHAVASRVGAETILLHLENGTYYGLDAVGARVWDLLQDSRSFDAICDILHEEYGISKDVLLSDMGNFIQELASQNLIHEQQD